MKKNFLFLLSAFLLIGVTACKPESTNSSSSAESGSASTTPSVEPSVEPSEEPSVEPSVDPSVESSVESTTSDLIFTQEELDAASAYLDENKKSVCAIAEGDLWKSYCSGGGKTIEILHAYYNQKTNSGDIAVLDGNGTVGLATPLSNNDPFPNEESDSIFRDFVYNACTIEDTSHRSVSEQRAMERICAEGTKVDEANIWNFRVSVDAEGKIYGMYPSSNQSGSSLVEPYFSDYGSTKANMSNKYLFWDMVAEDRQTIPSTGADNHIFQVAIPNGGFNIVESSYHGGGRWGTYKFNPSTEYDLISWAFLGSDLNVGTLQKSLRIRDESGVGLIDNPEDVYYLRDAGQNIQLTKLLVPGQLDNVRISYEVREGVEYKITTTFEYDPYDTYKKVSDYDAYLKEHYATLDEETIMEVEDLYNAIEPLHDNAELALLYLNTEKVRTADENVIIQYTEEAGTAINIYKEAVIALRHAMFELFTLS